MARDVVLCTTRWTDQPSHLWIGQDSAHAQADTWVVQADKSCSSCSVQCSHLSVCLCSDSALCFCLMLIRNVPFLLPSLLCTDTSATATLALCWNETLATSWNGRAMGGTPIRRDRTHGHTHYSNPLTILRAVPFHMII
jgi:hypothetical protein